MARSIGSIEIVVVANTKRLQAQLAATGKKAGRATAKDINDELDKIRARIRDIDGEQEAKLVRARIEEALRNMDASFDFTKARAQLEKVEEDAEQVRIMLDVGMELDEGDQELLRTDVKGFKEKVEADKIRLQLELDTEDVYDDAARARAALAGIEVAWEADLSGLDEAVEKAKAARFAIEKDKIQLQFDAAKSLVEETARVEAAKKAIEKDRIRWNIDFATALAKGDAEIKTFLAKERNMKIGMDANTAAAAAKLEVELLSIEAELPNIDVELEAMLNEIDLAVEISKINATAQAGLRDFDVNVQVGYDKAQKARDVDAPIEKNLRDLGTKAGHGMGRNIAGGLADEGTLIVGAIVTLGPAIAQALQGAAAASTAVLGSGLAAIGAAAGAATPLVLGFSAAIGAVVVGSQGFGTALEAITEEFEAAAKEGREVNLSTGEVGVALARLSPSARAAATAFAGIRDELHDMQLGVQEKLFTGLGDVIADFGVNVLPRVGKSLETLAESANEFGRQIADVAKTTDWEGAAEGLKPALDDVFDAATAVVETLEPFLQSASPAAKRLAGMIENIAENMRDWVRQNPHKLQDFLDDGLDSLEKWGDLTGSVTRLLVKFFGAGKESGDGFVDSLDDMIDRWNGFLETTEGEDSLAEFFESGRDAMNDLKPLLDGLQEAFSVLVGDSGEEFRELAEAVGRALPDLAELLSVTSELGIVEAFTNIVNAAGPLFDVLDKIPDVVFELAGQFYALYKTTKFLEPAFTSARNGINLLTKSLKGVEGGLSKTNGILLAVGAAVSVALIAYDHFTSGNEEAEQASKEFASALDTTIEKMLEVEDVTKAASVGVEAFNTTLGEGESGKKVSAALGVMNRDIDDSRTTMSALADDAEKELTRLAEDFGLPGPAAADLAHIVDSTDDSFENFNDLSAASRQSLGLISKATGVAEEDLLKAANAMETLTDETAIAIPGLTDLAETELAAALGGSAAEQSALKLAEANQEAGAVAAGVVPLYDEYLRVLKEQATAAVDAADSEYIYGDALSHIDQFVLEANAAAQAREEELRKEQEAAYKTWQEEEKLADKTKEAAIAASEALGFSTDLAGEIVDLGDAAETAAGKADALKASLDLLISPGVDLQQTMSDIEQGLDDYTEAIQGGSEATDARTEAWEKAVEANKVLAEADEEGMAKAEERAEALRLESEAAQALATSLVEGAKTMDITTEQGRANAELLREQAGRYLEMAEGMLATGESADVINAKMAESRTKLEEMAVGFGMGETEAANYVNTLLATPEFLTTLISTPGLIDALLNAEDLTLLYDDMGNPVITEFEAQGLDPALANSTEFKNMLDSITGVTATPVIDPAGTEAAAAGALEVNDQMAAADEAVSDPTINPPAPTAQDAVTQLTTDLTTLDGMNVTPTITIPFIQTFITHVKDLKTAIDNLTDKTVTLTVNTVGNVPTLPGGTGNLPGDMAGAMINGPTVHRLGERGYREAVIPMQLPLNRINPEVRHLAELIRNGGNNVTLPAGKTVNNYLTVTPASADPSAVATQLINRAAALANR